MDTTVPRKDLPDHVRYSCAQPAVFARRLDGNVCVGALCTRPRVHRRSTRATPGIHPRVEAVRLDGGEHAHRRRRPQPRQLDSAALRDGRTGPPVVLGNRRGLPRHDLRPRVGHVDRARARRRRTALLVRLQGDHRPSHLDVRRSRRAAAGRDRRRPADHREPVQQLVHRLVVTRCDRLVLGLVLTRCDRCPDVGRARSGDRGLHPSGGRRDDPLRHAAPQGAPHRGHQDGNVERARVGLTG